MRLVTFKLGLPGESNGKEFLDKTLLRLSSSPSSRPIGVLESLATILPCGLDVNVGVVFTMPLCSRSPLIINIGLEEKVSIS